MEHHDYELNTEFNDYVDDYEESQGNLGFSFHLVQGISFRPSVVLYSLEIDTYHQEYKTWFEKVFLPGLDLDSFLDAFLARSAFYLKFEADRWLQEAKKRSLQLSRDDLNSILDRLKGLETTVEVDRALGDLRTMLDDSSEDSIS